MSGLLAKILGTGDVVKAGIDLIDDMHTSKEEEIAARSKAKADLLNAYAPFKIAQRFLALMFGTTFLFCFTLVLLLTIFEVGNPNDVKLVMGEFYIAEIMFTIVAFYFSGGAVEGVVRSFRGSRDG